MLAGLLFATHDAEDRADRLAATLPFAGTTLIEHQARQMAAAGAAQLVVVVARMTPELVGALARVRRSGLTVDAVRTAAEAAALLHPLGELLVLADGLVTSDATLALVARHPDEVLAVEPDGPDARARLGGGMRWDGVARLATGRMREAAALPPDWDVGETLLRVASQGGVGSLVLPPEARAAGHRVERRADALERRDRAAVAAAAASDGGWFDRVVTARAAGVLLPPLIRRGRPAAWTAGAAAALLCAGLAAIGWGHPGVGSTLCLIAALGGAVARVQAVFGGQPRTAAAARAVAAAAAPSAALLWGTIAAGSGDGGAALVTGIAGTAFAVLAERARGKHRGPAWGQPEAYLAAALPGAWAGLPLLGLGAAAIYAAATAAAAVERLRERA